MWIKKIHIDDFGKFSNYDLELESSFTVLHGHNEDGKSTLMAFIQMMFYGYAGMARDISQNPRKKYSPWNGKDMKGYILFEDEGINYRLERHFGKSNTTDLVKVWTMDTGEVIPMPARKDPGEVFFALGSEAFERSVFIGQSGSIIQSKGKKDEITEKLLNMVTTGDENTSYQKVMDLLKKHEEQLVSRSKKIGVMDKMEEALRQLGQEQYQAGLDEEEKKVAQRKIDALKIEQKDLEAKKEEKDQILKLEGLYHEQKGLKKSQQRKKELYTLEEEIKDLKKRLYRENMILDEGYLAQVDNLTQEVKSQGDKIQAAKERQGELEQEEVDLCSSPAVEVKEDQLDRLRINDQTRDEYKEQENTLEDHLDILGRYLGESLQYDYLFKEAEKTNQDLINLEDELQKEDRLYQTLLHQHTEKAEEEEKKELQVKQMEKDHYQTELSLNAKKSEEEKAKQRHEERIQELEEEIKEAKVPKSYEVEMTGKTFNPLLIIAAVAFVALGVILGISLNLAYYGLSLLGLGLFWLSFKKKPKETMMKTTVNETLVKSLDHKLTKRREEQQKEEDRLKAEITELEKSLTQITKKNTILKEEWESLQLRVREQETLKNEKKDQVDSLKLNRESLSSKVGTYRHNLKEKKDSLDAYQVKGTEETRKSFDEELRQLKGKIQQLNLETQEILDENQVSSLEEMRNKKYAYDSFMEKKVSLQSNLEKIKTNLENLTLDYETKVKELLLYASFYEPVEDLTGVPEKMKKLSGLHQSLHQLDMTLTIKSGQLSLEEKTMTLEAISTQLKIIEESLQNEDEHMSGEVDEDQFKALKDEVHALQEAIYSLGNTITKEESTLKEKYREKKNVSQIENEIHDLKTQLDGLEQDYEALVLAGQVLGEAFTEIQRSFGPRLNDTTAKIFSKLTQGKYQKLQVNRDFDIIVEDEKEQSLREWKFLSGGTMDQAYLALRLSVATLLKADKENLPLFLDDVFMQYDDQRAYEALSFLQDYQMESQGTQQIILFTCHQRILNWAHEDFPKISLQNVLGKEV